MTLKAINAMATGRLGQGCTHFYLDDVRVSYDRYQHVRQLALMYGRIECMCSKPSRTRRREYALFRIP